MNQDPTAGAQEGADSARPDEEAIFDAALSFEPGPARDAYLLEVCGSNLTVRARIESLLAAAETRAMLDQPAVFVTPDEHESSADDMLGQTIGRYELTAVLGAGGMGVVYRAEQSEPVKRSVALKLIKLGLDTQEVVARFEAERQALAMMEHPNIARVLDAGATDLGRPYFVMELVAGVPITRYANEQRLSAEERIALFIPVCRAVQHAHAKGVIHRDLKPSNILVSEVDGTPVPKVIDFGVAKAIDAKAVEQTAFTKAGQLVGTPAYMSPEQAGLEGHDVDTRTDVYGLGVVLYELLTGVTPFDAERLRSAAYHEMMRMVREEDLPSPSTRLSSLHDTKASIAAARSTEPGRLVRILRGDLDWVIMRSLEKDRARRYDTVSAFADDLDRYLRGDVVLAGPPSRRYRAGKFVRKHRAGIAVASVLGAAIVGGAVISTVQAVRATRAEQLAEERADDLVVQIQRAKDAEAVAEERALAAEASWETTKAIDKFMMEDLLMAAIPSSGPSGRLTPLGDLIDAASDKLDLAVAPGGALEGQWMVQAELRTALSQVYGNMRDYDRSYHHATMGYPIARRYYGDLHDNTVAVVNSIANAANGLGRYDEALRWHQQNLDILLERYGPDHPKVLVTEHNILVILVDAERLEGLEARIDSLVERRLRILGADDLDALGTRSLQPLLFFKQNRIVEAIAAQREIVAEARRLLSDDHIRVWQEQADLARYLSQGGQSEEAVGLMEESVAGYERVYGPDGPRTLGQLNHLAGIQMGLGRHEDALATYRRAHEGFVTLSGRDAMMSLGTGTNIAQVLTELGRFEEALAQIQTVLPNKRRVLGEEHVYTRNAIWSLAYVQEALGQTREAMLSYVELYALERRVGGADHWRSHLTRPMAFRFVREAGEMAANPELVADELQARLAKAEQPEANEIDLNFAAFGLLTFEPESLRDPERALDLAIRANDIAEGEDYIVLHTVALAYEATGDPREGARWCQLSLDKMPGDGGGARAAYQADLDRMVAAAEAAE